MFVNILLDVMGLLVHKLVGCDDIYNWIYELHVDDFGLLNLFILFIVLVQKLKRKRVSDGSPGRYVKLMFCLVFSIFKIISGIILLSMKCRFSFLFFLAKIIQLLSVTVPQK